MKTIYKPLWSAFMIVVLIAMSFNVATAADCTTTCSYNGCTVSLTQGSNSWAMTVVCDGYSETDSGTGTFGGTICGGVTPCILPT